MERLSSEINERSDQETCFDVLAGWVETLHGHGDFQAALDKLLKLIHADSALVARFVDGSLAEKRIAASFVRRSGKSGERVKSYSKRIVGENLNLSQPGAVWSWSQVESDMAVLDRPLMKEDLRREGLSEVIVICLGVNGGIADYLEMHFAHLAEHDFNLVVMLAGTLARTWKTRLPGTGETLLARNAAHQNAIGDTEDRPILDIDNPHGLSRSEYRICAMVREGLLVKNIASRLSIGETTVRSHLHSIYAKTGTSCQVELLHRLSVNRRPTIAKFSQEYGLSRSA